MLKLQHYAQMNELIIHEKNALQTAYIRLLHNNYQAYLQKCFYTLNPDTKFHNNWHLQAIGEYLAAMQKLEFNRLIINIPPRSLKSIAITVAWSNFLLAHNPACKIITASYSAPISLKHSLDARSIISSPWHKLVFPKLQLATGQNEKHKFVTTKQGFRLATSIGGTLTGEGGDVIIIDDPQNPTQAASRLLRARTNDWYDKTLSSRLNDKKNGLILLVMQRLNPDDLSGHLLERGGFEHLCLPAIAPKSININMGSFHKTMKMGEILHNRREDEAVLQQLKRDLGEVAFSAQYLQSPINDTGNMVKREWINYIDFAQSSETFIIQSWDCAIKAGAHNDRSACVSLACVGGDYIVLDALAIRADFPQLKNAVINHYDKFHPQALLIEDKASGGSLLQELRSNYPQPLPLIAINPKGDKIQRLARITPLFEAGRIKFLRSQPWNDELCTEILGFPNVRHDDLVDSLTQAIEWAQVRAQQGTHRLRIL